MLIEHLFWLGLVVAVMARGFAFVQSCKAFAFSEGDEKKVKIAATDAMAYLKCHAYGFGLINRFITFTFLTSGFFTGLSGLIGMKPVASANARIAGMPFTKAGRHSHSLFGL